jgi:hypothetical protein
VKINSTKIVLIFGISCFLMFMVKVRVEADTDTAKAINDLTTTTVILINMLTSTTAAGFTALTSTTSPAFIGISGKFEELTSTTAAGFRGLSTGLSDLSPATISGYNNMLGSTKVHAFLGFNKAEEDKGEEDKGIEYYILYDKVAEEIDATRIQSLEHDDYFEIVVNNRLVLDISWRADNSRVARVWHMDIGTMNNEIENFYPKLTYLVGGETLAKDTKLSEIEPKYMIDEMLAVKEGVFKVDCPPEVDYVQKRFKVIGSFSVFCKYPTLASVLAKGIASGIVTLSDFDCNNAEDMDGVRVFVPTIKKGEVTTEQFKMQLKRNDAVLRGVIKTFERGQQIDPNFGRYSLLKAEPEASDDVNFFDTDPSLPFLKRMQLLFKFLKRSIATWSIDTETPIEL